MVSQSTSISPIPYIMFETPCSREEEEGRGERERRGRGEGIREGLDRKERGGGETKSNEGQMREIERRRGTQKRRRDS